MRNHISWSLALWLGLLVESYGIERVFQNKHIDIFGIKQCLCLVEDENSVYTSTSIPWQASKFKKPYDFWDINIQERVYHNLLKYKTSSLLALVHFWPCKVYGKEHGCEDVEYATLSAVLTHRKIVAQRDKSDANKEVYYPFMKEAWDARRMNKWRNTLQLRERAIEEREDTAYVQTGEGEM